jgi:hypothetical protein
MFFSSVNLDFFLNHYQIFNPENKMATEALKYINQLIQDYEKYKKTTSIELESLLRFITDISNHKDFQIV